VVRREREIFRLCAELSEDILHRDAFALRKRRLALVKAAAVLLGHGFIVGRGRGQGAGNGIDHHLEQMTDGGKLARIELVKQPMGMLSVHDSFLKRLKAFRRMAPASVHTSDHTSLTLADLGLSYSLCSNADYRAVSASFNFASKTLSGCAPVMIEPSTTSATVLPIRNDGVATI